MEKLSETAYLIVWSIIGSVLGFFTIRNKPSVWDTKKKLQEAFLSIGVGLFFALPTYEYLITYKEMSKQMSVLLSGSLSFCVTDLIISLWEKLKGIILSALERLSKNIIK